MNLRKPLLATLLLLSPTLALAHPGHDHAGVLSGIAHPIFGLDHLLAMVAVGLWAAQQTGKARWALPLIFVATMLLGGLAGFAGIEMPLMETEWARRFGMFEDRFGKPWMVNCMKPMPAP